MRALAVLLLLAIAAPALADPPPAAVVPAPAETVTVLRADWITVMAEAEAAQEVRGLLLQCQADVDRAAKKNQPAPGWYTAVKWAGVGGAIAGAFLLGMTLGR